MCMCMCMYVRMHAGILTATYIHTCGLWFGSLRQTGDDARQDGMASAHKDRRDYYYHHHTRKYIHTNMPSFNIHT